MEGLFCDLRFALRGLRRDRGFSLAALAMLSLALGLNVAVFSVVSANLFRGFPLVKRNDRLLYMQERFPSGRCCLSFPDFEEWRSQTRSFTDLALSSGKQINFDDGVSRPSDTIAVLLTANAFRLLGIAPLVGRDFTPADEVPGAPQAVIVSYEFRQSRFHQRADIAGLAIRINGASATVIGVMPEGFHFPEQEDLWMPLVRTEALRRREPGGHFAFGRLRDGVTQGEARAELTAVNRRLEADYPAANRGVLPRVDTYSQFFVGPDAGVIYGSLWTAAWFVLLIACANLANLSLARTIGRLREFSTRLALGAGQARMIRQILMESVTLAAVGAAFAWWLGQWSVRTWEVETASQYLVLDYRIDAGTLLYLAGISIASAILISLAPIGRLWQLGWTGTLTADARGTTQSLRGRRVAAILVAGQTALAIVLLAGAGVLARSLWNVVGAKTGVRDPESILVGFESLPLDKYPDGAARLRYFERLEAVVRNTPGVESAALASTVPVNFATQLTFETEGNAAGESLVQFLAVSPGYFQLLGAPSFSGREFNDADDERALPVALVNQSFVATYWPGQPPIGKRLRAQEGGPFGGWHTVVGVVPNIMQGDPIRQTFKPVVYVPIRQGFMNGGTNRDGGAFRAAYFLARTSVPVDRMALVIRTEIRELDSEVTIDDFGSLKSTFAFRRDRMDLEHAEMGKHAAVAPVFAVLALLLGAIGLYAVLAHSMSQRTREIGIRMAIGAAPGDIRWMILGEGMAPVAAGVFSGLTLAFAVNRILGSQLVGVSPFDPVTMTAAPVVLIFIALAACHIPARRAMNVDPAVALRQD